jgi:hypothetical protein
VRDSRRYAGKPPNRVTINNMLINLHCFLDRVTASATRTQRTDR